MLYITYYVGAFHDVCLGKLVSYNNLKHSIITYYIPHTQSSVKWHDWLTQIIIKIRDGPRPSIPTLHSPYSGCFTWNFPASSFTPPTVERGREREREGWVKKGEWKAYKNIDTVTMDVQKASRSILSKYLLKCLIYLSITDSQLKVKYPTASSHGWLASQCLNLPIFE